MELSAFSVFILSWNYILFPHCVYHETISFSVFSKSWN